MAGRAAVASALFELDDAGVTAAAVLEGGRDFPGTQQVIAGEFGRTAPGNWSNADR